MKYSREINMRNMKILLCFIPPEANNINTKGKYSQRKYYCYHQNAKYFLVPFINSYFSNKVTVIFLLSPLRARKCDNYRYCDSWKSDNFRERAIKKEAKY